jgi:hypothetical protein
MVFTELMRDFNVLLKEKKNIAIKTSFFYIPCTSLVKLFLQLGSV